MFFVNMHFVNMNRHSMHFFIAIDNCHGEIAELVERDPVGSNQAV